jgi:hypothetical protein
MSQNDGQTTAEVTEVPSVSGTVAVHQRVNKFIEYLSQRAELNTDRGTDIAFQQADKIIQATESGTLEEIWDADEGGVVSAKDFVGVGFMLHSVEYAPSSDQYDAPLGHFVSMNITALQQTDAFEIGEELVVNTGASAIVTKTRALEARGALPAPCIVKAVPARKGAVLKLRPFVVAQKGKTE